jgi:chromate transporter
VGAPETSTSLRELAWVFLRLGATSFGGPAAHIALMEEELVLRRAWLSREAFLDLLGAVNVIPGPNSTEMAIHIGYVRAGWRGLIIAGVSFILPAALLVTVLAWAYVHIGQLPPITAALYGVKPVVVAIVLHALWRLARTALHRLPIAAVACGSVIAAAAGMHELLILAAAAVLAAMTVVRHRGWTLTGTSVVAVVHSSRGLRASSALVGTFAATAPALGGIGLGAIFGIFLKIGSVIFGSGYVLLAFLRADLVERYHWLTEGQLLDAVAAGQLTPGPLFTTATFIGYLLAGLPGAGVATLGIFLPAFVFVAASGPLMPKLRGSAVAAAMFDGINAAALALMAVVTWQLGRAALVDIPSVVLAVLAASALFLTRVNSIVLLASGAVLGWVWLAVRGANAFGS